MQPLTFCLIQTITHWHDAERNRALFADWFEDVPETAQVVVLPEMFSTGFTMAADAVAEPMDGPTMQWLIDAAAALDKVVCGSFVAQESGRCYNRFVWVQPNGEYVYYDKRHLFRMAGEHNHYAPGVTRPVIEHAGWRICPFVCYDLRFPVWLRNRGDYDVLLGVANWPAARQQHWNSLLRARAIENLAYVVAVNRIGSDGNNVAYRGGSAAYHPNGEALLEVFDDAGVFTITLDGDALALWRERFPAHLDADRFSLDA
jgi:omega-amidase